MAEEYSNNVLNPFMETLVAELLEHQPEDVLRHALNWLREQRGDDTSVSEKDELMMLRAEAARLKENKKDEESGSESSYCSEEDDYIDDLPVPVANKEPPKRKSVSEEAYGLYNKQEAFEARFIPKSEDQIAQIKERLTRSFMFSALDDKERNIVIGAMEERKFAAGDAVIMQGEDGDELFVVDTGELECWKIFPDDDMEKYLKDYISGDAFGELALLYNAPRAATIRAKTDALLWALDRATFKNIVKDAARKKREQYEDFLSKVDLLEDVDAYERSQIADAFKPANFNDGDYVIREGDWGEVFYFVTNGEAIATKTLTPGHPPETVKEYAAGDYFGELALLKGEPRAANIVARGPLNCVTLDRHAFKRMLGPLDEILQRNAAKYEEILKNR